MLPADQGSAGGSAERAGEAGQVSLPAGAGIRRPFCRGGGAGGQTDLMCGLVGRRFRSNSVTFYKEC